MIEIFDCSPILAEWEGLNRRIQILSGNDDTDFLSWVLPRDQWNKRHKQRRERGVAPLIQVERSSSQAVLAEDLNPSEQLYSPNSVREEVRPSRRPEAREDFRSTMRLLN